MDKQIEEMVRFIDIHNEAKKIAKLMPSDIVGYDGKPKSQHLYIEQKMVIAKEIIKQGAVVLTREQYEKDLANERELGELKAKRARKETAEKFAERLKAELTEWLEDNEELDGKINYGIAMIELIGVEALDGEIISLGLIDEICEEITEGK